PPTRSCAGSVDRLLLFHPETSVLRTDHLVRDRRGLNFEPGPESTNTGQMRRNAVTTNGDLTLRRTLNTSLGLCKMETRHMTLAIVVASCGMRRERPSRDCASCGAEELCTIGNGRVSGVTTLGPDVKGARQSHCAAAGRGRRRTRPNARARC